VGPIGWRSKMIRALPQDDVDDCQTPLMGVDELIGDAGFEPVFIGALDPGARLIEDGFDLWVAIVKSVGLYFPRYAVPGQL
jgi:hypothetical protein